MRSTTMREGRTKTKGFFHPFLLWFPRAATTNYYRLGWLKTTEYVPAQFWRMEVQNQGVGRVGSHQKLRGRACSVLLVVAGNPGVP